ncbi:hypothetical protein [Aridibaculum aurantiacum]|uniref:hypothetical protein n=1 Tax=Aridibaculum aurantiacum TaxID=2810307 RepID=UPI001A96EBE6|nr:hypothetical protein [Aridibaculum aurantiacum]
MKFNILLCLALCFFTATTAQTNAENFTKLEGYLNKVKGKYIQGLAIVEQRVNENKITFTSGSIGVNSSAVHTNLKWNDFYFFIKADEDSKQVATLQLNFEEPTDLVYYEGGKKTSSETSKQVLLYVLTSDKKAVERLLEKVQKQNAR